MNISGLDPKLQKQLIELEKKQPVWQQVHALQDIASITQELLVVVDDTKKQSAEDIKQLGALLTDARNQLVAINAKEAPDTPDYTKPLIEAVNAVERALSKLDLKPEITLPAPIVDLKAPDVNVTTPELNLKPLAEILKTIPKAFKDAILSMPEQKDDTEIIAKLSEVNASLADIDTGVRMKTAFPNQLKVTNVDGSAIGGGTQYADGAARGTATGTLLMVDDGTNIQSAIGTTAGVLKVDLSATTANATAVKTDSSATTQPVSAASLPLPTGASTEATLALIKAKTDNIPAQGQALAAASTPVVLTAAQITTLTPPAQGLTDAQLRATAVPVSGTVTANIGTSGSLALDATLTGGTQKAIARGGAKGATVAADLTSNPIDANTQALHVDGSKVTQPVSLATNTPTLQSGSTTAVTQATATNLNAAVVGTGIAGTPAGNILTVQGVAAMTKLLVTPDSIALPANQSVNVNQINAVTPLMGNGVTGTGSQRVTIASDGTAISTVGYMSVKIDQTTPGTTNKVDIGTNGTVALGSGVPDVVGGTTALGALNAAVTATVSGKTGVEVELDASGTLIGTIIFEATIDGTNWYGVPITLSTGETILTYTSASASASIRGAYANVAGEASVRARVSAYTSGTRNSRIATAEKTDLVRIQALPQKFTYNAGFRLAEAAATTKLAFTQVANTSKQWATIYHPATAIKTVRLLYVAAYLSAATTAAWEGVIELRRLSGATAPATGVPAITPVSTDSSAPTSEVTCLSLPTTQGTEFAVNSPVFHHGINKGITTAPVDNGTPAPIVLFDATTYGMIVPPTIRAGVAEGYAIVIRSTGVPALTMSFDIIFTEE